MKLSRKGKNPAFFHRDKSESGINRLPYANIHFERATGANHGKIRISFDPATGSWAYGQSVVHSFRFHVLSFERVQLAGCACQLSTRRKLP